ncbi:hypothetical protein ABFV05_020197 [Capra hircus]
MGELSKPSKHKEDLQDPGKAQGVVEAQLSGAEGSDGLDVRVLLRVNIGTSPDLPGLKMRTWREDTDTEGGLSRRLPLYSVLGGQGLQEPGGDGGDLRGLTSKEERPCNAQEQPSRKTSQRSPFSLYHTPTGHKTPVIMPVVPTNELCTSEEDLQGQIQAQGPVEAQLLGAEAEDASTPLASFPPDSSSSAAVDAEILFKQAVNVMTAELLEFLLLKTWAPSSPQLRPCCSHQGPSLSETQMSGSLNTALGPQYEIRMSGTPPPVPGPLSETRVSGTPPPVPGPLSETRVSGTPPPVPGPLSETRVSGTPPPVPGPLSETRVSGTLPPVPGPLSETRVSGNQTMLVAVIISQGVSGPTAGMGFSEVSSHWGPGSPQSSLRHLTLPLGQRSPFSPCHTPTGHKTPVIMPVVPTNELCTSEEDLQGQIQAQGPVEAQLLGAEAEDASTPVASFPPDSSSSAAVDAEILFKQAVNVMTAELLEFLLHKKWWAIVNSHRFVSIWWEEDCTCVGINEELFEEILERMGSKKMAPPMVVVGPTTVPTQIFNLPPGQLPVAMLVPLCAIWMPVMPARPDPNLTLTTQALNPFYYCSGSPSFP